jgi:hypothetical protein
MKNLEIKVGENFIVTADEYNWILKEKRIPDPENKRTKSTEPKWVVTGYFGNIEFLARALLQRVLKTSESKSIQDLISVLQQTENNLKIEIAKAAGGGK